MRKSMKESDAAYRAVAVWIDRTTNQVLNQVIVGPYSTAGTAKGSLTQAIGGNYGLLKKHKARVDSGEVSFARWVEESATTWTRL